MGPTIASTIPILRCYAVHHPTPIVTRGRSRWSGVSGSDFELWSRDRPWSANTWAAINECVIGPDNWWVSSPKLISLLLLSRTTINRQTRRTAHLSADSYQTIYVVRKTPFHHCQTNITTTPQMVKKKFTHLTMQLGLTSHRLATPFHLYPHSA